MMLRILRGHVRTLHWHRVIMAQLGLVSEWIDVLTGKEPNVTADLIRKAFYPADEHVADAATAFFCRQTVPLLMGKRGRGNVTCHRDTFPEMSQAVRTQCWTKDTGVLSF